MNAARYQEIQDMREPRTKRSEFRTHAKLAYRPMTPVSMPAQDDATNDARWELIFALIFAVLLTPLVAGFASWALPIVWGWR